MSGREGHSPSKFPLESGSARPKVTAMRRILEVVFGHKLLLTVPLVAAVIGTAGFLILQPPSYQSTATVFVNAQGLGTQSAAQTQSDTINQYLKTDAFAVAVAAAGPLGAYLDSHPSATQSFGLHSLLGESPGIPSADAIRTYLAAHVTLTQLGPSELTIAVNAPTAELARGTADSLLSQLAAAELAAKIAATQTQLQVYQTQLQQQSAVLSSDLAAVHSYLVAHPNLANNPSASATDPQLALLQDRASVDQQTYLQLLAKIQQAQSDLALAQQPKLQPFRIVDAPQTPAAQSLLGKQQLVALAAGLLGGLLAVIAIAALLVRLDTTVHTAAEVQSMLGLTAIGSTPLSAGG